MGAVATAIIAFWAAVIVGSFALAAVRPDWRFAGIRVDTMERAWPRPKVVPDIRKTFTARARIVDRDHAYIRRRFRPLLGLYTPAGLVAEVRWGSDVAHVSVRLPVTTLTYFVGISGLAFGSALGRGQGFGASLVFAAAALIFFSLFLLPWIPMERERMVRMLDEYESLIVGARA
ncbi:MAG: hypothetical protein ACYC2X_11550 [Coriobacteriia bacterium]